MKRPLILQVIISLLLIAAYTSGSTKMAAERFTAKVDFSGEPVDLILALDEDGVLYGLSGRPVKKVDLISILANEKPGKPYSLRLQIHQRVTVGELSDLLRALRMGSRDDRDTAVYLFPSEPRNREGK